MKKWLQLLLVAALAVFVFAACSGGDDGDSKESNETDDNAGSEAADGDTYVIGVSQIVEHPSLDNAYKGFQAAFEEAGLNVEFDYQNAQGDQKNVQTISEKLVNDGVDLIFANSTPSALGALNQTNDIPIVFTSVTDAVDAGLVTAMDEPGPNITGVVDMHPEAIESTVDFIEKYFDGAKVGLIYNAGEKNSVTQIEAVEKAAEGKNISFAERTVSNSQEVQQAATTLAEDVDLFFIVTDNTVVSALESVVGVANEQQVPLMVAEPDSLEKGGFATFGIDYYTIGHRTGEMAIEILEEGKSPADIDVEYPASIDLILNKEAIEAQNVEWHDDWDEATILGEE